MLNATDVFSWVKSKPREFIIILVLLLLLVATSLFWLRLTGHTVQLPFLEKYVRVVSLQSDKYTRIVGKYKYRCKSAAKNHGGVCTISVAVTDNGLQWKLLGERRWEEYKDSTGKFNKADLNFPYAWTTVWGDFLSDNSIGFSYEIMSGSGSIKGYAEGEINSSDEISGRYWQLSPDNPVYGHFEFKRRTDDSDTEW